MACVGCGGRRKIIAQVVDGNKPLPQGVREIGSSIRQDLRAIGNAIRPNKLGVRIKQMRRDLEEKIRRNARREARVVRAMFGLVALVVAFVALKVWIGLRPL